MLTELWLILLLLYGIYWTIQFVSTKNRTELGQYPPGPWGLPIVGHLPFLGKNPALTLTKWKKIYGPIFSIKLASIPVVVLNDLKSIKEAFNLQTFSGRPLFKTWVELSNSKGLIFSNAPSHSEQRSFVIKTLSQFGVRKSKLEFSIQEEIQTFLNKLKTELKAENKRKKVMDIHRFFNIPVINAVWAAVIGDRFEEGDPTTKYLLNQMEEAAQMNSSVSVQASMFFPWYASILCYFGANKAVNKWHSIQDYIEKQIKKKRKDHVAGEPRHFTDAYFDRVDETKDIKSSFHFSKNEQRATTGDIFAGSIDTTSTSLDWMLLYMAREQGIQRKLQEEIDSVVGNETPSLSHKTLLPFTEAVIEELLRITSLFPLGVFHRTTEDIILRGFRIPKDTTIIANHYGVHQDPEVWPEPEKFLPERFLSDEENEEGKRRKVAKEILAFGFGKRNCIGEGIARDQLFLFTASFFQQFSVSCTTNVPSVEGNFGFVWNPGKFELIVAER